MWHSYATTSDLLAGTRLLVTGGDQAAEIVVGDTLDVTFPDGGQRIAVVLFCEGHRLVIQFDLELHVELFRSEDETGSFAELRLSDGFSRQIWMAQ